MWEAFSIGLVSGLITNLGLLVLERSNLDDPCGVFVTHGLSGIWGLLAVGIFGITPGNMRGIGELEGIESWNLFL